VLLGLTRQSEEWIAYQIDEVCAILGSQAQQDEEENAYHKGGKQGAAVSGGRFVGRFRGKVGQKL
jgi:hypothetical protein